MKGEEDNCSGFETWGGFPSPKGNVCYSEYSGDTAPSLIDLGAEVKIKGPEGESVVIGAVASNPIQVTIAEDILMDQKITDDLIEEVSKAAYNEAPPPSKYQWLFSGIQEENGQGTYQKGHKFGIRKDIIRGNSLQDSVVMEQEKA